MVVISKLRCILVFYFLIRGASIYAQDNNYWTQQYGNVSTLLGGAVTGSYNDNGSIYYNPATLAFTDTIKISLGAALYQSSIMNVSNATADDTVYSLYGFKRFPITFYPVFRLNSKSRLGFIYLSRIYSNFKIHDYKNEMKDVTGTGTQNQFIGTFDYRNELEETWYGLSYSRTINKYSSFGLCLYGTYRYQDVYYTYSADVVMNEAAHQYLITDIEHFLSYDLYQGIIKTGYFYEKNNLSLGCALTLPSFYVLSYSRSNSRFYFSGWQPYLAGDTINDLLITAEEKDQRVKHKYPASLSVGLKNKFNNKFTLYVTAEFYQPIKEYQLLKLDESENVFPVDYTRATDMLLNSETASRFFANISAGVQFKIKNNKELVAGFCTDFNSLPKSFDPDGFNTSTGRNNIYHATAGMDVHIKKIKINGGIKLSYGYSRNQLQFVDMKSASTANLLIGDRDYNSDYNYFAFNLLLGFNF